MAGDVTPRRPIARAAGVIEAPHAAVAGLLLTVHAGPMDDGNLFLLGHHSLTGGGTVETAPDGASGGVERFRLAYPGGRLTIEVDRARGTIATQGGWWYRGEYALTSTEDGTGTVVELRVYNVAGAGSRWAVPLANGFFRGFGARTRAGLETTLASAAKQLGAGYRMLDV